MSDWTTHERRGELIRRAHVEAHGTCPDSGEPIAECWGDGLCDCAWSAPIPCPDCGRVVWSIRDHNRIVHRR